MINPGIYQSGVGVQPYVKGHAMFALVINHMTCL